MKTVALTRDQVYAGPLILVNTVHPIQSKAKPELAAPDGGHPDILMERRAARLLSACFRAVHGSGIIVPVSGWRSQAEQQQIWNDTLRTEGETFTRQYVALPGCSEHQTGLAIDLGRAADAVDFIRPDFPNDGACGAFRRAAANYGFLQRYTKDKESLTGIAEEPWHFRYVGVPHARLMEEHRLCLEEYVPFLQERPRSCSLKGGQRAQVSWLPCPGTMVEVELPEGCCQISGDNVSGFIVTVWEVLS